MKLEVKYYAVHDLEKVVATTQRTASVSMIESMAPAHEGSQVEKIDADDAFTYRNAAWPVLLWIRYPLERLASSYTIFGRFTSFEEFIQRVLSETNPHWSPVTKLHSRGKVFLPTHVFTFEDLADTWAAEMPGYDLQYLDKTPQYPSWADISEGMPHPLLEQVMNHFHDDFALHRWANKDGVHWVAA